MSETRLSIIGAGSTRYTVPVITALASYFGERPLEITLYDADEERLDLFDRFARLCFMVSQSSHVLKSTTDIREACDKPDKVILQVGANCGRRFLRENRRHGFAEIDAQATVWQAVEEIIPYIPLGTPILSLLDNVEVPGESYRLEQWIPYMSQEEKRALPFQVLRYIHGEEAVGKLIQEQERSPLKRWLDDPNSAELVRA